MDKPEGNVALPSLAIRDVLDYLAPGGVLLFSIYVFELWLRSQAAGIKGITIHTPLLSAVSRVFPDISSDNWLASFLAVAMGLVGCYTLGHAVASASALLIERAFVYKSYGYPFHQLLAVQHPNRDDLLISNCFYRSIFFWVNAFILLVFLRLASLALNFWPSAQLIINLATGLAFLVSAVLILFKIASLIKKVIEPLYPGNWLSLIYAGAGFKRWRRRFAISTASPYNVCTFTLSRILNTRRGFDDKFVQRCRFYFERWFRETPEEAGTNTFWLCYCFVMERSSNFSSMLSNWRMQYAFARNLSVTFYLAFAWILTSLLLQYNAIAGLPRYSLIVVFVIPLAYVLLGTLMLARYYYIFWSYFSKFVFRAFVYLNDTVESSPNPALKRTAGAAA